ncbi:invasion associated locus B family protein [Bartonella ancashensis]|nr:invasion associated locus B family protein [Bartonella ancashensis]
MIKFHNIVFGCLLIFSSLVSNAGFAHEDNCVYTVHPPRLSVPSGEPGEVRRVIMQFYHWTLLCDENPSLGQGVCNVTQTIHDEEDHTIFSWSLVLTKSGQAVMLLRMLPDADINVPIQLFIEGKKEPIFINYTQCDDTVCLAQILLEPVLSQLIEQESSVRIFYQLKDEKKFVFMAPFKGLREALTSLQR